MSGDQPAPPDAQDVRYVAPREELTFKTAADKTALTAFYKTKLGATGWKQDDEKTYRIDDYDQIPYRAPDGDVMFLKVWPEHGGTRNVTLEFISKEAITDMDKESKERKAAGKDKQPATPLPAPEPEPSVLPKIAVPLPADATNVEKEDQRLKFRVAKGRGQSVAEGYQRQFKAAGWKEESATFKPTNGTCAYSKDGNTKDFLTQRLPHELPQAGWQPAVPGGETIRADGDKRNAYVLSLSFLPFPFFPLIRF